MSEIKPPPLRSMSGLKAALYRRGFFLHKHPFLSRYFLIRFNPVIDPALCRLASRRQIQTWLHTAMVMEQRKEATEAVTEALREGECWAAMAERIIHEEYYGGEGR